MEGSKEQSWKIDLDILRIMATCAVVLLHTVSGIKDTTDMNPYPEQFRIFLAILDMVTWSVPIFIMISGYLFLSQERNFTWKQMLGKYCRRIALALLLFGVPYAMLELMLMERTFRVEMIGKAVLMVLQGKSWSHMWYLYLIFFLYLITPAVRFLLQKIPKVWVYGLQVILLIGSSIFVYINKFVNGEVLPMIPAMGIYIFYYLCGYLFVSKENEITKKSRIPGWVLLLCVGLLVLGMVSNRLFASHQVQMAYEYPGTVFCTLLLFGWAKSREWKMSEKQLGLLRECSGLCFAIYLIHPVFLNIAYKFLHLTVLDYPLWMSLPLFWLTTLLLSAGCAWILRKIPVLRRYVL